MKKKDIEDKVDDDTSNDEKKSSPLPIKLQYKVETANGVYTLKRPVGRIGITHFTLVTKSIPTTIDEATGQVMISPADQDRFTAALNEWCQKVLPEIFVDGPVKPEQMPGEDQYAIFLAMFSTVNLNSSDLFRFVE
jgi:hypothetical protein